MNVSKSIRQFHRWLSIAFTLGVIANMVAMMSLDPARQDQPAFWVNLLALVPLGMLLLSGLCLFVLPYATRRRGSHAALQESV